MHACVTAAWAKHILRTSHRQLPACCYRKSATDEWCATSVRMLSRPVCLTWIHTRKDQRACLVSSFGSGTRHAQRMGCVPRNMNQTDASPSGGHRCLDAKGDPQEWQIQWRFASWVLVEWIPYGRTSSTPVESGAEDKNRMTEGVNEISGQAAWRGESRCHQNCFCAQASST